MWRSEVSAASSHLPADLPQQLLYTPKRHAPLRSAERLCADLGEVREASHLRVPKAQVLMRCWLDPHGVAAAELDWLGSREERL